MHQQKLSRQGRLYSSLLQEGRESRMQSDLNATETKVGGVLIVEDIGFSQRKSKLSSGYMISGAFTSWSEVPTKVRLLPSNRDWEIEVLSSLLITFQKDGSQSLRKTVLHCKTGKRLFKRFTSQRGKEYTITRVFCLSVCFVLFLKLML